MSEHVPNPELFERLGISAEATVEPAAGGASASAWRVAAGAETYVLRRSSAELAPGRLAAMEAARLAGLPAPELLARAPWDGDEALLLSWLPGTPMLQRLTDEPAAAIRVMFADLAPRYADSPELLRILEGTGRHNHESVMRGRPPSHMVGAKRYGFRGGVGALLPSEQ